MKSKFIAALSIAVATPVGAQTAPASAPEKRIWLDEQAPLLLAKYDVPSVGVAYIENGEIAFVRQYGQQSWGFPANDETLYNVASLTKPVTAEVVLRLATKGDVSLDMPLADHHVEKDVADDPRIRMLTPDLVMRHRTGFTNWRYQTDGVLQFSRDPDTKTGYSGEGYEWMMKAVAAATGRDFEAMAQELVFDPADMPLSGYTVAPKWRGHLAVPYKAGEAVHNAIRQEPVASDDLRTTPREYARFMLSVFEGDDVSPELRQLQSTIVHSYQEHFRCDGSAEAAEFCPENEGWGLGWFVHDWGDRTIMQHSGGDHGEASLAIYDPVARRGVIALTNGAEGHRVMVRIVGSLFGDERVEEYFVSLSDNIGK
ncbi:serine hydrolase domain-containing protein [Qipengyuania sphaerica]|uniref:serine hydrolase domain-containing protein n=1 Tax=Qipengyuania sphaerica TaxID=2867243 RepID=UPI001C87F8F1|nr:serine hydrolase domain-containing protein [Qipengyuania sphaerica]MBX7540238.1 beta-lactamase family protein [Qipengyuania sphaerica]